MIVYCTVDSALYLRQNFGWQKVGSGGSVSVDSSIYATRARLSNELNLKQATLVSGTNIKTLGGHSLLGSGDFEVISPLQTVGGMATQLSINQATTASDGYLSSTDWNTFNNKKNAADSTTASPANYVTQYQRKKTSDSLAALISAGAGNFATTNLTQTADRSYNGNAKSLSMYGLSGFDILSNYFSSISPTIVLANDDGSDPNAYLNLTKVAGKDVGFLGTQYYSNKKSGIRLTYDSIRVGHQNISGRTPHGTADKPSIILDGSLTLGSVEEDEDLDTYTKVLVYSDSASPLKWIPKTALPSGGSTDTTSLSNRINTKQNLAYTAKDTLSTPITSYPAGVYNVNNICVGVAYNQSEAVTIWNANGANIATGAVSASTASPFSFSKQITLQPQTVIGTIFNDDFNRGFWGSNYDTSALTGVTSTFSNGFVKMHSASGAGAFTKIASYIGKGKMTLRNFDIEIGFRPCTITSGTYGPILGTNTTRNPGQNTATVVYPDFSTNFGPAFTIGAANSSGVISSKATTTNMPARSIANNYTLKLKVSADTAQAFILNRNTSEQTSLQYIYDFTNLAQSATKPNIFYPAFGLNGLDSIVVDNFKISSPDKRYVKMVFVGNSITTGYYGGMARNSFPDQLKAKTNYDIQILAGGYNRTADVIDNLWQIIDMHPENVFLEIGTNDRGNGISQATIQANIDTINNRLNRAGIKVYHLAAPDAGNPATGGTTNNYLSTTYGSFFVNTWTGCYGAGQMVDAVHPNQLGFRIIADTIQAKLPLLFPINGAGTENILFSHNTSSTLDQVLAAGNTSATKLSITGTKTTNSGLAVGPIEIQPFAVNNNWFGDNMYYDAGFKYRATGYGSLLQFFSGQVLLNNFNTKTAGTTASGSDFTASFKNDYIGNVGLGGNISSTLGSYTGAKMYVDGTSGNVGIGTTSPAASSLLDITSTTKGFLPPRMTTTQMNAISSPAFGLEIFNITDSCKMFYNGSRWQWMNKTSTYIPTYTSTANIASTVVSAVTYTLNGNMITLAGEVEFGITTPTTATELRISLPSYVTNNFTATSQGGGTTFNDGSSNVFTITPVTGTTLIAFKSLSPSLTSSYKYPFTVSFRIL